MSSVNDRRSTFKDTTSTDQCRRKRQETTLQIRKTKRGKQLHQRRHGKEIQPQPQQNAPLYNIPKLASNLASPTQKLNATSQIRCILETADKGDRAEITQAVINHKVLPHMVENILNPVNDELTFECCSVKATIAEEYAGAVVHAGAIEPMVELLRHPVPAIRLEAARGLFNISEDDPAYRDLVLVEGTILWIAKNIKEDANAPLLRMMLQTLDSFFREGVPKPSLDQNEIQIIVQAMKSKISVLAFPLSDHNTINGVSYMMRILHHISDGNKEVIQVIIDHGMFPHVIAILKNQGIPNKLMIPALKCLGSFVTGTDDQAQVAIDMHILPLLCRVLDSPYSEIRKQACWILSNIAAGSINQITALMKVRGMIKTIFGIAMDAPWELRKEALFVFANIMISGSDDHTMALVQSEGLLPITKVLAEENAEPSVLCAALDALEQTLHVSDRQGTKWERLFDEYNGIQFLEGLQHHSSDEVYNKALKIVDTFFNVDEDEDENLAPETTASGTFGFGVPSPKRLFEDVRPTLQFGQVSNRR